jgi:hypothetical protein
MSFIFFLFNFFISFHYIIIFLSRDFTYLGMDGVYTMTWILKEK